MTTTEDPDQIRRDIEQTQRDISGDVDALTEKLRPRRIVERRVDEVRGRLFRLRDTVMGSATEPAPGERARSVAQQASDQICAAGSAVSDAASAAMDTVQDAPQLARRQARGNPLAAGLIVFGAGWLVSSLLPPSRREQEIAVKVRDVVADVAQPVAQQVGEAAEEIGENLREPARQALESVKETAADAASTVMEQGRQVQERAHAAGATLRETAQG